MLRLALLLVSVAALFAGINWYRHRFVRSGTDLLKLLPSSEDATVFYAQMDVLRTTGLLSVLAGSASTKDPDYQAFVKATQFDYSKDLDAVAGVVKGESILAALKGRFDWLRMGAYVRRQGGTCAGERCYLPGSQPKSWVSIVRAQPDVIGIALGSERAFSLAIHPGQAAIAQPPRAPVWVKLAPSVLKNPTTLPVALRIFALSVQPANSVLIALNRPGEGGDAFEIQLDAQCPSAATADTIKSQLQIETKMLKLELAHEHREPNPADLTGLLTSGTFAANGKEVAGNWPVRKELIKTLQ